VVNALIGSLVFSRITRSKRPVTGVTDSMLVTRLSWLTMCPSSPLAFAKTKLVDADLDIFSLKVAVEVVGYLSASEPSGTTASNSISPESS
jgi:hypothetical protein